MHLIKTTIIILRVNNASSPVSPDIEPLDISYSGLGICSHIDATTESSIAHYRRSVRLFTPEYGVTLGDGRENMVALRIFDPM